MPDETFSKPICIVVPLSKANATENDQGDWIVSGPVAPETADYEGDAFPDALIRKGLSFFGKFGSHDGTLGQVDWAHMYPQTRNPKWLIGRGKPVDGSDGRAWCATYLLKAKEIAQEAWKHFQAGGFAAYSLDGKMHVTQKGNGKRVPAHLEIHRMTIDPSPLGFGNFLQIGMPANTMGGTVVQLSKALATEMSDGHLSDNGWISEHDTSASTAFADPLDFASSMDRLMARYDARFAAVYKALGMDYSTGADMGGNSPSECPDCGSQMDGGNCSGCGYVQKAMMAGSGIVGDGATGGAALRTQTLKRSQEQVRCPKCGCRNLVARSKCRHCGRALTR